MFAGLREMREKLRAATGLPLPPSIGKRQDFEVAVQEGATLWCAVGTAL